MALLSAAPRHAEAQAEGPAGDSTSIATRTRIFQGRPFGHEAVFSPFTIIMNRGYEIVQVRDHGRAIFEYDYARAAGAVSDALVHPHAAVKRGGGWKKFLRTEILPLAFGFDDAGWFPNYLEHLLGGGLTNRMLVDWYDMRGAPYPRVLAGVTSMTAAFLNEVMEHPNVDRGAASTVADIYVFDLGGVLVFSWDPLARFFREKLHAADWSPLASVTLPNGKLHNNGLYLVYKIPLPGVERVRFLWRLGLGSQAGLSLAMDDEHSLSVAFGADTERRFLDPVTLEEAIEVVYSMGVFYDRDDSLLASLMLSQRLEDMLTANVYPGVLPGRLTDIGVWLTMARNGETRFGVVHRRALGIGIGLSR